MLSYGSMIWSKCGAMQRVLSKRATVTTARGEPLRCLAPLTTRARLTSPHAQLACGSGRQTCLPPGRYNVVEHLHHTPCLLAPFLSPFVVVPITFSRHMPAVSACIAHPLHLTRTQDPCRKPLYTEYLKRCSLSASCFLLVPKFRLFSRYLRLYTAAAVWIKAMHSSTSNISQLTPLQQTHKNLS